MTSDAIGRISELGGLACYVGLAVVALWGAYCVSVVWRRSAMMRFRDEREQAAFLDPLEASLAEGDYQRVVDTCLEDPRAMAQLALLAVTNRDLGFARVRHLVADMFQRDVLADLQYRVSWIYTVIRTVPMLGLFGTVLGMMAAFSKLSSGDKVDATRLSADISLALVTTALGLAIAIPLTLCVASINIRIRKLEDLVALGLTRFLESLKAALARA